MWFVKEEAELKNFFELASVRVSMDETSEIVDFSIDELIFLDPDGPRSHVSAPLNSSDIDMIWSGWNELRLLHEQFLKELRTLISMDVSVSHVLIAEKMIEHARRLRKPLGEYTANMIHVTPFIRSELRRNREFQRFCSERQKLDDSDGLPIDSMLIVPVQRPTRYLLLLKEMSKNIAAQDQDKINAAMDELKDLNTYFDECVSIERVVSLETKIAEPWLCLSQKGRGYIMDGVLRKTQDGMFGMESSHVRHFYLMSDCLFYTKTSEKESEKPQGLIYLKHLVVEGKEDQRDDGIKIECFDKKWSLYASNPPEHNAWLNNIRRAMRNVDELKCLPCVRDGYKGVSFKVYGLYR